MDTSIYEATVVHADKLELDQDSSEAPAGCAPDLGYTALCASCPLVRMFGECPKALREEAKQQDMGPSDEVVAFDDLFPTSSDVVPSLAPLFQEFTVLSTPIKSAEEAPRRLDSDSFSLQEFRAPNEPTVLEVSATETVQELPPTLMPATRIRQIRKAESLIDLLLDDSITAIGSGKVVEIVSPHLPEITHNGDVTVVNYSTPEPVVPPAAPVLREPTKTQAVPIFAQPAQRGVALDPQPAPEPLSEELIVPRKPLVTNEPLVAAHTYRETVAAPEDISSAPVELSEASQAIIQGMLQPTQGDSDVSVVAEFEIETELDAGTETDQPLEELRQSIAELYDALYPNTTPSVPQETLAYARSSVTAEVFADIEHTPPLASRDVLDAEYMLPSTEPTARLQATARVLPRYLGVWALLLVTGTQLKTVLNKLFGN